MRRFPVWCGAVLSLLWLFLVVSPVVAQPSIADVLEGKSLDVAEVDPAIVEFFERFNKALAEGDSDAVMGMFDSQAFCAEVERSVSDPDAELMPWQTFEAFALPRMAADLCRPEVGVAWRRMQIKALKELGNNSYAVTARHWDHEGTHTKTTWYLRRSDIEIRLYDINQLDLGVHWSRLIASTMFQGEGTPSEKKQALLLMYTGMMSGANGNIEVAIQQLRQADNDALPELFRGMVWVALGSIYYDQGNAEQALAYINQVVILESASPFSHYMRAACLNDLGRHDEALVEADRYARSVGVDADVLVVVGDAYLGRDEYDVAFRAYEKALEDDPQHIEALFNVLYWLDDDKKAEFEKYYAAVEGRSAIGQELASWISEMDDPASLSALLEIHSRLHPEDDWVKAYSPEADVVGQ